MESSPVARDTARFQRISAQMDRKVMSPSTSSPASCKQDLEEDTVLSDDLDDENIGVEHVLQDTPIIQISDVSFQKLPPIKSEVLGVRKLEQRENSTFAGKLLEPDDVENSPHSPSKDTHLESMSLIADEDSRIMIEENIGTIQLNSFSPLKPRIQLTHLEKAQAQLIKNRAMLPQKKDFANISLIAEENSR